MKRSGTLLLSGSDDHRLVITDPFSYRLSSKSVNSFVQSTNLSLFAGSEKMCAQLTAQISSQLNSSQRRPTIKSFPAPATERSCTRTYSDKRKPSTPSSTAMEALSTRWRSCLGIQTHFSLAERMGLCDGSTSGRSPNVRKKIVGRMS